MRWASLALHLFTRRVGDQLTLTVLRDHTTLDFKVLVVERPQALSRLNGFVEACATPAELGILAVQIDDLGDAPSDQGPTSGVVVAPRVPSLRAADVALSAGDLICTVNDRVVSTLSDLQSALRRVGPGGSVALQVMRDGQFQYVAFRH